MDHANVSRPNVRTAGPTTGIALKAPAVMLRTYQTFHTYGVFNDGGYQNQTCQQANYDCIPEYTGHGNQSLSGRVSCSCTCVNDRSRTQTGFICEQTSEIRRHGVHATTVAPTKPPPAAAGLNAPCTIAAKAAGICAPFTITDLRYNLQCTDQPLWESASHIPWR